MSLRKCSQTPSLFSEIVKNFPIRELDVQKLCFTFAWKPYGDSERTLELEDEFDIVGVDYLCELIKDAPCWSELGGGLRSMCLIEVDITASQTRSEEMFASKSRVSESR